MKEKERDRIGKKRDYKTHTVKTGKNQLAIRAEKSNACK